MTNKLSKMADSTPIRPAHIEDTVAAIAQLRADHYARLTPVQRIIDAVTAYAGRPSFTIGIIVVVASWIAANLLLRGLGSVPFDPPPFAWLQGIVAVFLASIDRSIYECWCRCCCSSSLHQPGVRRR